MPDTFRELASDPLTIGTDGYSTARNLEIETTSPLQAEVVLRQHGIYRGAVWRTARGEQPDDGVACRTITITGKPETPVGTTGIYACKATYERGTDEPIPGGPPVYRLKGGLETAPVDIDRNGHAITNSAGEPIDPPLAKPTPSEILVVTWYEQAEDALGLQASLRPYRGATNSSEYRGAYPESLMCEGIEIDEELPDNWIKLSGQFAYREPIRAADLQATLYFRDTNGALLAASSSAVFGGWWEIYPDRGRRVVNGQTAAGTTDYKDIVRNGKPVTEPVSLNGAGAELAASAPQVALLVPLFKSALDFADLGI